MEGGNAAMSSAGDCSDVEDLSLLSTYYRPTERLFVHHNATSAASAMAARMAARLQAAYPDAWPETVRALMVHSAEWTPQMREAFLERETRTGYGQLLRICGYGVPDYRVARECATNSLTLISERNIQPFDKKGSRYITRDMHLHELPWPRDVLLSLGDADVTMRITLSYFIEPGPGQIGWRDRYRYASHGLRFDVNSPGESCGDLVARLNQAAREEDETPDTDSGSDRWLIGKTARSRGSVHSDVLQGTAADIAGCNLVGVFPVIGWWRGRAHLQRWARTTRYSLVVSIRTPKEDVDIYTPVATQLGIVVPVEIAVEEADA